MRAARREAARQPSVGEALEVVLGGAGQQVEEGVEAALLGLKLNTDAPALTLAMSYNHLGLAYTHGGSFERADLAFQRAIMASGE